MNQVKTCLYCNKEYIITKSYQKRNNFCCKSHAQLYIRTKNKTHNLDILLNNDNESFYWVGFILADGYFNNYRLSIEISNKDIKQLEKFKMYTNTLKPIKQHTKTVLKNKHNMCSYNICDKLCVQKIKEKFDIKPSKTYNPPDLVNYDKFTDEQLFSLFIGFIDGDGNIRMIHTINNTFHYHITLENHTSWKNFYRMLELFLFSYLNVSHRKSTYIRSNNRGYICLSFTKKDFVNKINIKRKELQLPVLERKWSILDSI